MDAKSADMGASNNSSDFVRKLYKMLEDPAYESIVCWGDSGDSFVVLENEKFTKTILPKHFKHSNFASFVRQLNKYDFHKVRQNNEGDAPSKYGSGAWEFKHPEFKVNNKDSLENIRRKAPAPRKAAQAVDDGYPAQQMDLYNTQLMATQQQLQHLQDRYNDLASGHIVLLQQVVQLQKHVKSHESVMHRVMGFLQDVDAQRRNSRIGGFGGLGDANVNQIENNTPASPLQQAAKLLDEVANQPLQTKELEQKVQEYQHLADYSTPPHDPNAALHSTIDDSGLQLNFGMANDLDNMVYPVGHNIGIDPINSEHINNIPYGLPAGGPVMAVDGTSANFPAESANTERKKSVVETVWGPQKPRILLVEDDKLCVRVGCKFLHAYECIVETASDGLEACNKIASNAHFDLILMDIIMPNLDGVSATACIRQQMGRPNIPIIAMTSNIRADDIDTYFRYGMNDVLPKPFTKQGMLKALEKHLSHLKKTEPSTGLTPQMPMSSGFPTPTTTQPPLGLSMGQLSGPQSLKDESSPGKSPASAPAWQSPSQPHAGQQLPPQPVQNQQMPLQSPIGNQPNFMSHPLSQQPMTQQSINQQPLMGQQAPMGGPVQYNMPPTNPQQQQHRLPLPQQAFQPGQLQQGPLTPGLGGPRSSHRRVMSDMTGGVPQDENPDKRQRMYAPPPGGYQH